MVLSCYTLAFTQIPLNISRFATDIWDGLYRKVKKYTFHKILIKLFQFQGTTSKLFLSEEVIQRICCYRIFPILHHVYDTNKKTYLSTTNSNICLDQV